MNGTSCTDKNRENDCDCRISLVAWIFRTKKYPIIEPMHDKKTKRRACPPLRLQGGQVEVFPVLKMKPLLLD